MNSKQYEELCRYFLADQLQIPIDRILTVDLLASERPGSPPYDHQIDLYWETEDKVAKQVHIANAKWRTPPGKLDQEDVLLIQKVRDKVGAHKAVLLTNFGFTDRAVAVAHDERVALHVVRPQFDPAALRDGNPAAIRSQLEHLARVAGSRPLYACEVIRKSLGAAPLPASSTPASAPGQAPWYITKAFPPGGGGPPSAGSLPGPGGGFRYVKK